MKIQHNMGSLNTYRNLTTNKAKGASDFEKLVSGSSINRAADNASGLAISEKMRGQIRGLDMAQKNVQDAIGLVQTAEGAMEEIHAMLQRGRELSVQAANDTNTPFDREQLQKELEQINDEITHIANRTDFNTRKPLKADELNVQQVSLQAAANEGQSIAATLPDISAKKLGIDEVDITTYESTAKSITSYDKAIEQIANERSYLGAVQNRLEHATLNLGSAAENLIGSESRIRDTDMASGMMNLTKNNILSQSAQSMLAQANQQPQGVLQLLG
ncbi:MAG: flagellin [Solibacillus sp.]